MYMKINAKIILIYVLCVSCVVIAGDDDSGRDKLIEFLRSAGMSEKLDAPVRMFNDESGEVVIVDEGDFLVQYQIMTPEESAAPDIIVDDSFSVIASADKLVIVTHGWLDKGKGDWPSDVASAVSGVVDPNEWVCGYFDWKAGAVAINPVDAAKYARDIAGPRLAKAILSLDNKFEHVHLIAHSAGCWAIDSAARTIARKTSADIHLTFLDAYVPPNWPSNYLGGASVDKGTDIWAEHYYTKDITLDSTHINLPNAHNVDLTPIDIGLHAHEFPYRWYYATITGKYRGKDPENGHEVVKTHDGIEYGFARGLEASPKNWQQTIKLKRQAKPVRFKKTKKKPFDLNGLFKPNSKSK